MWFNKVPWNVIQEHCLYSTTAGFHWPSLSILLQGLIHLSTYHFSLSSVFSLVLFRHSHIQTNRQTCSCRGTTNLSTTRENTHVPTIWTNGGIWWRGGCFWKKSSCLVEQGWFPLHWVISRDSTGRRAFSFTLLLAAIQHRLNQAATCETSQDYGHQKAIKLNWTEWLKHQQLV